jgi:hypothetical protein
LHLFLYLLHHLRRDSALTIAMCYMSPEGPVLGADSTSSIFLSSGSNALNFHYLNNNQKLFEIGENSTLGAITWGLGGLGTTSYRTLFARIADDLAAKPANNFVEVVDRWIALFWSVYSQDQNVITCRQLAAKAPYDPGNPDGRTPDEEKQLTGLQWDLGVGFCLAGYCLPDRIHKAYQMYFEPVGGVPPPPIEIQLGACNFWGAPNMIKRLIFGVDENIEAKILASGKWTGTDLELRVLLNQFMLNHPILPIRDAIDFVYSCIYSTIKAMKFSNLNQVCGGPIEIAVITTDRKFRWVRHKQWDAAITEGAMP